MVCTFIESIYSKIIFNIDSYFFCHREDSLSDEARSAYPAYAPPQSYSSPQPAAAPYTYPSPAPKTVNIK